MIKVNSKTQVQAVLRVVSPEWEEVETPDQVETVLQERTRITAIADACSSAHYEMPYSFKQTDRI